MRSLRTFVVVALVLGAVGATGLSLHHHRVRSSEIAGLWTRFPDSRGDGDPVRFYFFHPDGFGLYRYGKIGLNNTNSFDWKINGDQLVLTFRKTGEVARTPFTIRDKRLVLARDPREPLADEVAYTFVPAPLDVAVPDLAKIGGRLWLDKRTFATGGEGFTLYQLKDAAIDGRGVGWHHIGDFDDWSTEALSFREAGDTLELAFTLRGDRARTQMMRAGDKLTLVEDPRGYWHVHTFVDAGPSFGWLQ